MKLKAILFIIIFQNFEKKKTLFFVQILFCIENNSTQICWKHVLPNTNFWTYCGTNITLKTQIQQIETLKTDQELVQWNPLSSLPEK